MQKIYYSAVETKIGKVYLAGSERGLKLLALNPKEWRRFVEKTERKKRVSLIPAGTKFRNIEKKLNSYFKGGKVNFNEKYDWEGFTPFQKKVWNQMLKIPYGETRSYKWLAAKVNIDSPRAVGQACGSNPLPIVVPCHRVIASDGSLGGYGGGLALKEKLLSLEKKY